MKKIFALLVLVAGCVPTHSTVPMDEDMKSVPLLEIITSSEKDSITFHIPLGSDFDEKILINTLNMSAQEFDYEGLLQLDPEDSTAILTKTYFSSVTHLPYKPATLFTNDKGISIHFVIDKDEIISVAQNFKKKIPRKSPASIPIVPPIEIDDFSYLPDNLLLEPCPGVSYPKIENLIPNAPRTYRSGTHRGIDFPAPYGTPIRATEDGVIIRADHDYKEVTNEFRKSLLKKAAIIGRTPSDIFEHILFGRTVFIDHGVNLVDGKRLISIYAHMSEIEDEINVGVNVKRGDTLGKVGNSGTSDGALKNRKGAHLHFELIIQDKDGERYMGKGLNYKLLTSLLDRLFTTN